MCNQSCVWEKKGNIPLEIRPPNKRRSQGALDLAVAYLKNYAVDKADALYTATEPFCAMVPVSQMFCYALFIHFRIF